MPSPSARVFSYGRFSTPVQGEGDSEARQQAAFDTAGKAYAKKVGLSFDEDLRGERIDRGLSGFHGAHRKRGKLGIFLAAVESGKVAKGSHLVVENIDRLTREAMDDALETIVFRLINRGIVIYDLSSGEVYDKESLGKRIYRLIAGIDRAHEESKRKQEIATHNWRRKREEARNGHRLLTTQCPAWLRLVGDSPNQRFEVIPEAAKVVKRIFKLRQQGLGVDRIVSRLNASVAWTPPPRNGQKAFGWRRSYVTKILSSVAVIGTLQPFTMVGVPQDEEPGKKPRRTPKQKPEGEPIPGYYPRIIPDDLFYAVQTEPDPSRRGNGGRVGRKRNLFTHFVHCGYCGGAMFFLDKGVARAGTSTYFYYQCDKVRRRVEHGNGKCVADVFRYSEVESLVLDNLPGLRPDDVLPARGEAKAEADALRLRIVAHREKLKDNESRQNNLTDQIESTTNATARNRYEERLVQLAQQAEQWKEEQREAQRRLDSLEAGSSSWEEWQRSLGGLKRAIANAKDPNVVETRMRLAAHLREFIDRVEVFPVGFRVKADPLAEPPKPIMVDGKRQRPPQPDVEDFMDVMADNMKEANPRWKPSPEWKAFAADVTRRRMTKEGRFVRVTFRTGARVDLVPPGSLACGRQLTKPATGKGKAEWQYVQPDVSKLLEEFTNKRTKTAATAKPPASAKAKAKVPASAKAKRIASKQKAPVKAKHKGKK